MTPQRVMISAPYMLPVVERFRPQFAERGIELVLPPVNERLEEADLLAIIGEIDGVICGDDRFTERVLQAAPRLKVIAKWGTGIDSIDQEACKRLGIAVRNTPNAFSEPVADTVLGSMLCFARNLLAMDRQMKTGTWHKIPGRALRECTLGVIGVGDVGKAVVRRAVAFGMRVLGNDLVEMPADFAAATGIQMMSKAEVLHQADFISLNCDLNPTSYHLLSSADFARMQPHAVVINTARGPVIDEAALVAALQQGQIAGAGLDVFEDEPLPPESPLRRMDNVLLAPHNANSSPAAWEHVHQNTIRQLLAVLEQHHV
jgi:D-3-phosphoglycerate dehydrogenase